MPYIPMLTLPEPFFRSLPLATVFPLVAGFSVKALVDFFTGGHMLAAPSFQPPKYVFISVWSILYPLMGYASYRAWTTAIRSGSAVAVEDAKRGSTLYTIQLVLNLLWLPIFYGVGASVARVLDIVLLDGAVVWLAVVWAKVDRGAAWCLVPYIAWVSFASYVAFATGQANGWDFKSNTGRGKGQ